MSNLIAAHAHPDHAAGRKRVPVPQGPRNYERLDHNGTLIFTCTPDELKVATKRVRKAVEKLKGGKDD
jgi:hypothetical protein